ncbi:hypothetical protein AB0J20_04985 [Micromonospora costi]|uniref:hypothetical protein n=1 Tax=Micromonospora costi TaxID=1530042 RepID=UPI0033FAEB43
MLLGIEYRRDLAALGVYMAQQLQAATDDLRRLDTSNPPQPNALYERFLSWIRTKGPMGPDHPMAQD